MEWVLAVRNRSLVALPDPRLVLTTPKDGVIGLPDRPTGVNTTSPKPILDRSRGFDARDGCMRRLWHIGVTRFR